MIIFNFETKSNCTFEKSRMYLSKVLWRGYFFGVLCLKLILEKRTFKKDGCCLTFCSNLVMQLCAFQRSFFRSLQPDGGLFPQLEKAPLHTFFIFFLNKVHLQGREFLMWRWAQYYRENFHAWIISIKDLIDLIREWISHVGNFLPQYWTLVPSCFVIKSQA